MVSHILNPSSELARRRQPAKKQKVAGLQKRRLLAQLLYADATIFEHAPLSVDIADRRFGGGNTGKARHKIMRHNVSLPLSMSTRSSHY